jgi:ribosomal protein S18 acetylase RimI-like enzyme
VPNQLQIVSIVDQPESYLLGQQLVAEYVQATALEMQTDPNSFLPYVEGYATFPGAFGPDGDFLVAQLNGAQAGCLGIKPLDRQTCEMKSLWVRPSHRGLGVAKALIRESLLKAESLGFEVMELDVLPSRQGAIALYRALDFEQCPVSHEYTFEMIGFRRRLRS